ncbi:MAG: mycothiol system anti-sigma-R factor [Actinomycetota bacterium]
MTSHEHEEIDCSHALMQVYEYLDGEMGPDDCAKIRQHLAQCGPCMDEYDVDQMLKKLVRRSCGGESAPTELRMHILARITTITLEIQG